MFATVIYVMAGPMWFLLTAFMRVFNPSALVGVNSHNWLLIWLGVYSVINMYRYE